jgi:hypothetical protein
MAWMEECPYFMSSSLVSGVKKNNGLTSLGSCRWPLSVAAGKVLRLGTQSGAGSWTFYG